MTPLEKAISQIYTDAAEQLAQYGMTLYDLTPSDWAELNAQAEEMAQMIARTIADAKI